MEFVLHYRGRLLANAGAQEKHRLREHFHIQLKALWDAPPLRWVHNEAINPHPPDPGAQETSQNLAELARMLQFPSLVMNVAGNDFVPLVNERLAGVADLEVLLLRPEASGRIVTQGGDIDNRIKTLLDALKVPDQNQASAGITGNIEQPFYCLLEDDNLITRLSVRADRLLESTSGPNEVVALIRVCTGRRWETKHNHVIA